MKHIIHEIRQQPHHIRELATLLCTIAVVAVVVLVWFHSFQKDVYGLLNPTDQPQAQDQLFAKQSKSLFGSIIATFNSGKAQILDLFGNNQATVVNGQSQPTATPVESTHPLPVSPNK